MTMDLASNILAALAGPAHAQRFLRLHTALGSEVLIAETLDGVEQIDGIGFQWTITALSVDAGLQLQPLHRCVSDQCNCFTFGNRCA